jgi:hypothetical protein
VNRRSKSPREDRLGDYTKENQLYAIDSAYVNQILPNLVAGNDALRMGWDLRRFDTIDLRSEFKYSVATSSRMPASARASQTPTSGA